MDHGVIQHESAKATSPSRRRRVSVEEDCLYQQFITSDRRPSESPPPYPSGLAASGGTPMASAVEEERLGPEPDVLPPYSCSIHAEGVFMKKMEIEDATRRADDRQWHHAFVVLHGTALNFYRVKRDWGWGSSREGPGISPDNPPWMKKGSLERSYSLLHADVGIAADYKKRRYVVRIRAETDQFLISCVELENFIKWLEVLFAAIDIAAPLEERCFPRDHSIPRIQRIRWFHNQQTREAEQALQQQGARFERTDSGFSSGPLQRSRSVDSSPCEAAPEEPTVVSRPPPTEAGATSRREQSDPGRVSTTSYLNDAVNLETGKWEPRHKWTTTHDMLYAKLCYAVLLFQSPRKSNYVIMKGKQWFVDWATGRMIRVQPPAYGEVELFGPFQIIAPENRRI